MAAVPTSVQLLGTNALDWSTVPCAGLCLGCPLQTSPPSVNASVTVDLRGWGHCRGLGEDRNSVHAGFQAESTVLLWPLTWKYDSIMCFLIHFPRKLTLP